MRRIHAKIALHAGSVNWNSVLTLWNKLLYWSLSIREAWIEIECMDFSYGFFHRPHAGSENWNEVTTSTIISAKSRSPRRERELKSSADFKTNNASLSRSIWGAWVEIVRNNKNSAESYITPHGRSESWNNFADNENLLRKQNRTPHRDENWNKYFLRNYAFALRLLTPHKKRELKYHFFSIAEAATQSFPLRRTRIEILLRIIDLKDNNAAP